MTSSTASSCSVPWVLDDKSVCTNKQDMNTSYWAHYNRITNQQDNRIATCLNHFLYNIFSRRTVLTRVLFYP